MSEAVGGRSCGDSTDMTDPFSLDVDERQRRLALAASIVAQRPWCECCQPHADAVDLALHGASIAEIQELHP